MHTSLRTSRTISSNSFFFDRDVWVYIRHVHRLTCNIRLEGHDLRWKLHALAYFDVFLQTHLEPKLNQSIPFLISPNPKIISTKRLLLFSIIITKNSILQHPIFNHCLRVQSLIRRNKMTSSQHDSIAQTLPCLNITS